MVAWLQISSPAPQPSPSELTSFLTFRRWLVSSIVFFGLYELVADVVSSISLFVLSFFPLLTTCFFTYLRINDFFTTHTLFLFQLRSPISAPTCTPPPSLLLLLLSPPPPCLLRSGESVRPVFLWPDAHYYIQHPWPQTPSSRSRQCSC